MSHATEEVLDCEGAGGIGLAFTCGSTGFLQTAHAVSPIKFEAYNFSKTSKISPTECNPGLQ
jgi:hypothetical protein